MENIENTKIFQVPHKNRIMTKGGKFLSGNDFAHSAVAINTNFTSYSLIEPPITAGQSEQKVISHPV